VNSNVILKRGINDMDELDRYIAEALRVRQNIQIYIELFTEQKSIDVLNNFSKNIFSTFKRAMHDEIILSISRLFDTEKYKNYERLSHSNLTKKYQKYFTERLIKLKDEVDTLLNQIDIRDYRNAKGAHNDKLVLTFAVDDVKHNIDSKSIVDLVEKSIKLMIGIKCETQKNTEISLPVNPDNIYVGEGFRFIEKLKTL
jgi:hypothetical protein